MGSRLKFTGRSSASKIEMRLETIMRDTPNIIRKLAVSGSSEHQKALRLDLGGVPLVAVAVGPLAGLQVTLDVDLAALAKVLAGDLGLLAPHHDAVPLGTFLSLARLVGPLLGGRHREVRDRGAALGVTHLRIASEIADQHHLVQAGHGKFSSGGKSRPREA